VSDAIVDFARVSRGSAAHDALVLIDECGEAGQREIDLRVFREMDAGELTPEKALAFWFEKRAVSRLLQRLHQQANIGNSAAGRLNREQGNG
jgi:hypothetical protein